MMWTTYNIFLLFVLLLIFFGVVKKLVMFCCLFQLNYSRPICSEFFFFFWVYSYSKPLTILITYLLIQRLCNELIEKQANPTFKTRLANALHSLTNSNQLSSTLDRINCRRFRKNLLNFLIEVRGFLRVVWRNLPSLRKGLFWLSKHFYGGRTDLFHQ